jgi:hypothetical protein
MLVLLVLLAHAGCGNERAPWNGFPLFPGEDTEVHTTRPRDDTGSAEPETPSGAEVPDPAAGSGGSPSESVTPVAGSDASSVAAAGGGAAAMPPNSPVPVTTRAFRFTELSLRDPHFFVGLTDATERPVLGMSINHSLIPDKLTMDADGDGFVDVSIIVLLRPFDPHANEAELTLVDGNCPVGRTKSCTHNPKSKLQATWTIANHASGTCLEPLPNTTNPAYEPAATLPTAPCFVTTSGKELVFNLGGVDVPIIAGQVSASYRPEPAPGLIRGLVSGFVTTAAAKRTILPDDSGAAPTALNDYVRQADHDLASSPTMEDGFWIYMNFVAESIEYTP